MLDFQYIKDQYPQELQRFERSILREYLQHKILQAIFDSKYASKLSFIGGTALRIIHGNMRFSEDIDLDNFGLSWLDFEEVVQEVQRFMKLEGFEVEIRNVAKGAYRCYLRFPQILFEQGLSPIREEKILVQIDTSAQGYDYKPDNVLINKFDVYTEYRVTPINILLSQKIYTSVNRKRPKGRDFYDISVLVGKTKLDMGYIQQKMEIETKEELKVDIARKIEKFDFSELVKDVSPFLIKANDIKRVEHFKELWDQVEL